MTYPLLASLASALLVLPGLAGAATRDDGTIDQGTYIVYAADKPLGTETFTTVRRGDSLLVASAVEQTHARPEGDVKVVKSLTMVVSAFDFGLRRYESKQEVQGKHLLRAVTVADTTISVFREDGQAGVGTVLTAPPGRLFVIDPMLFALFDVMCQSLHERTFVSRPLSILVLGPTDSLLAARVDDLGVETLRWGAKPVKARKLRISDSTVSFFAWLGPSGHMLRLEQPEQKLRVERQAPRVKRRDRPEEKPPVEEPPGEEEPKHQG
jgi:hypothetical protein